MRRCNFDTKVGTGNCRSDKPHHGVIFTFDTPLFEVQMTSDIYTSRLDSDGGSPEIHQ